MVLVGKVVADVLADANADKEQALKIVVAKQATSLPQTTMLPPKSVSSQEAQRRLAEGIKLWESTPGFLRGQYLLGVIQGSTGSSMELEIQLAALLDSMSDVAASVTVLEGDGFLAPIVTDIYNEHCRNKNSHGYNRLRRVLQKYSNELCREKASDRLYNEAMEDYAKKRMDAITTSMINVTEAHVQEEGMPQQGLLQSGRSKKATAAAKQFAEQQAEAAEKSQNAKTEKLRKKAKAAAQELLSMEPPKREDHVATEIPPDLIQEVLRDHLHTWIKKFDNGIAKGDYDFVVRCKDTFDLFDACTFFNPYTQLEQW